MAVSKPVAEGELSEVCFSTSCVATTFHLRQTDSAPGCRSAAFIHAVDQGAGELAGFLCVPAGWSPTRRVSPERPPAAAIGFVEGVISVSYTHLTLPTNREG